MVEIRFGTYIAEWPSFDTREWERHTEGQMITWRRGYWEGGKIRVSKGYRMAAAAVARVVFELCGKSHSPPPPGTCPLKARGRLQQYSTS